MISLQSKGLLRVFAGTTVRKHQFFGAEPSFYGLTLTSIHDYWKNRNSDCCCCLVASVMPDSVQPPGLQSSRLLRLWDSPGKNTGVGCHFHLQCMKVKSQSEIAQSCPNLSNPMDCSPSGSSIHGIFQARVLEWGAITFSMIPNPMYILLPHTISRFSSPCLQFPRMT